MVSLKIQEMVDLAAIDITRLRKANTCGEARNAWESFLEHSNRAINRLEIYARKAGQTEKYKSTVLSEIWDNDLTKYVRLARNNYEHGIANTDMNDPYNERIMLAENRFSGLTVIGVDEACEETYIPASEPMRLAGSPGVRKVSLKAGIMLLPVHDRCGNIVRPPHVACLEVEDESQPTAVARMFLAWVIQRIETFS